jgi:hypothetical protein
MVNSGDKADAAVKLRVFVMGCSRGGTTLTQRLVADRLGLSTYPETRFFANMVGNVEPKMFPRTKRSSSAARTLSMTAREALGLSTGNKLLNIRRLPTIEPRKYASFSRLTTEFLKIMDDESARNQTNGWLEKTPFHVFYAPLIAKLVPDAWMIHIIRDAEETVGSIRDAANRYHDPWAAIYDRVERDVDNWNASIEASTAMIGRPRQIFIPYAALTRAPERVMDRVAAIFGGVAGSRKDPEQAAKGRLAGIKEMSWKAAALEGPVEPAESKWATALTHEEQRRAKALIRPIPQALEQEMAQFHYIAGPPGEDAG